MSTATNDIQTGYKQTDVGVIPTDWDVVSLDECADRITDGEHLTPQRTESGYYLLSARNVFNGRIDLTDVDYVGEDEYRRIRKRCNPDPGDVLISCSGTVGRVATVPEGLECVMVRSAALVKPKRSKLIGLFAQYFLQSRAGQTQIFATLNQGAQANLFQNHIQGLLIALPSTLPEQEAIAEALGDADAWIESLEQLVAKKRHLKQAAMQQLLTGKTRLPGFEGEWDLTLLHSVLRFQVGFPFSSAFFNEESTGVRLVRNRDLKSDDQVLHYSGRYDKRFLVNDGDVLVGMDGDFLPCLWNKGSALLNQRVGRITVRDRQLSLVFAYYYLIGPLKDIENATSSTTVKHLAHGDIEFLEVPLPAFDEQTAISEVLSDMDAEIEAIEAKLAKARQIKQGMMQELLTGKTRLI